MGVWIFWLNSFLKFNWKSKCILKYWNIQVIQSLKYVTYKKNFNNVCSDLSKIKNEYDNRNILYENEAFKLA